MWLLLLALPLQGFAAATMIQCGPNHHRMAAAAAAGMSGEQAHAAVGQHHHPMDSAGDHGDAPSGDGDAPSVHHLDKVTKFKCSACAACCMGAAMPTAAVTLEASPPAIAPGSRVPAAYLGFVTDGPDRPPRPTLV